MQKQHAYDVLENVFDKTARLRSVTSLLHWDTETHMPARAYAARAEQLDTLESVIHAIITDNGVEQLLDEAENAADKLNPDRKRNLALMRRTWKERASVPLKLSSELTKRGAECCAVWKEAKAEGDFKRLQPYLEKVVETVRNIAAEKAGFLKCKPYEALADSYDPGRKEEEMDALFKTLKERVPTLIENVCDHQAKQPQPKPLSVAAEKARQHEFAQQLLKDTGFIDAAPNLSVSAHPFCSGEGDDVRVTARYDETNVLSGIMALMHESGHALYEYNLPRDVNGRPLDFSCGMAVHESQSLLVEMQLCRTPEFISYLAPKLKKFLGSRSRAFDAENVYRLTTQTERGFIRVDADEVTYPAHILVRYYIERYLINGDMEVGDIPDAWQQGYEKFLGVSPPDHAKGCMQDIHWMDGSFGYFPSYTIGAMYAACLGEKMRADIPGLSEDLREGDFSAVRAWLTGRVHRYGCIYEPDDLIAKACGEKPSAHIYLDYLENRYLSDLRG